MTTKTCHGFHQKMVKPLRHIRFHNIHSKPKENIKSHIPLTVAYDFPSTQGPGCHSNPLISFVRVTREMSLTALTIRDLSATGNTQREQIKTDGFITAASFLLWSAICG